MSSITIKQIFDTVRSGEQRSPAPPAADFFLRHSALMSEALAKVSEPARHATKSAGLEAPVSVRLVLTMLLREDLSQVQQMEVIVSQIAVVAGRLELGLQWNIKQCDPVKTPVDASLV